LRHLSKCYRAVEFSGACLGLSLTSYRLRELLLCWLGFSLLFVLLALAILVVVLACYAGRHAARWVLAVAPDAPVLALGSAEPDLKALADGTKR
jgi:hypothetical protein